MVDGALWYEESLPAETILAGLVSVEAIRGVSGVSPGEVHALCVDRDGAAIQVGGKATVGKGRAVIGFSTRDAKAAPDPAMERTGGGR